MRTELERLAHDLEVELREAEGLLAYGALVAQWSRRLNLTGAKDERSLVEVLFADALILMDRLPPSASIVDVGAGAGAPAIPLLQLRPDSRAVLIEPRRKRVAFLRTAIGSLGLVGRAEVREERLEDARPAGAPFDVAISRATFEPSEWLTRARGLAARVVVLATAALPAPGPGQILEEEHRYALPSTDSARILGIYASGS